jgi:hypothetical protein
MWRAVEMKRKRNITETDSSFEDICWITNESSSRMSNAGAFYIIIVIIIQQSWIPYGIDLFQLPTQCTIPLFYYICITL